MGSCFVSLPGDPHGTSCLRMTMGLCVALANQVWVSHHYVIARSNDSCDVAI